MLTGNHIIQTYCRFNVIISVDPFKRCLDKYLRMVPDEPHISGYTALRRADSNSLFDMAQFANSQLVSTLEEPDQDSVARGGHHWPSWD